MVSEIEPSLAQGDLFNNWRISASVQSDGIFSFQNSPDVNARAEIVASRPGNPTPVRIAWRLVITLFIDDRDLSRVTAISTPEHATVF